MSSSPQSPPALKQNLQQLWASTPLIVHKLILAGLLLLYFYYGYMEAAGVNKHHPDPLFADIFLDHLIPLVPAFILFYMLGYLFVAAPIFFLSSRRETYAYAAVFCVLLSLSLLIFTQLPIAMDKEIATGSDWLSRLTRFQQQMDSRFNNLPSLHVSLNLLTYLMLRRTLPKLARWLAWVVPLIVASTLLVKQHLVLDCISGLFAGLLAFQLYRWLIPTSKA